MLTMCCCVTAMSQSPAALHAVEDLRFEAASTQFSSVGTMLVARSGDLVVTQPSEHLVRAVGATGMVRSLGRMGDGVGEFQNNWDAGLVGDSVWIADFTLKRLTVAGPSLTGPRVIPYPSILTAPSGAQHPLQGLIPWGVYADGTVLAVPLFGVGDELSDLLPAGQLGIPIVVIDRTGHVRRTVAVNPRTTCTQPVDLGGRSGSVRRPFCVDPQIVPAPDGSHLTIASDDPASETKPTFHVTTIAVSGDTVYSVAVPFAPVNVPQSSKDSALTAIRTRARQPALALDVPDQYPPFRHVIAGRDGSAWIELWTNDSGHIWLVLDRSGHTIGSVRFPPTFDLRVAESALAWGVNVDGTGAVTLLRYRIVR
jgi:hypothetical protein